MMVATLAWTPMTIGIHRQSRALAGPPYASWAPVRIRPASGRVEVVMHFPSEE